MEFKDRLCQMRKQRGLSQEALAEKLNVSRQTVSKWETGDSAPDMQMLIAIGELFGVSLDTLILGKESTEKGEILSALKETAMKKENKDRLRRVLKIIAVAAAVILAVDITSMILYFLICGQPK